MGKNATTASPPAPAAQRATSAAERIDLPDALRGLALFGIALAALGGLEHESPSAAFWTSIPYALGVVPLGLAYAAAFVLACPAFKRWLGLFAPVGRMALTNYLSHSVLGVLIFFGLGMA